MQSHRPSTAAAVRKSHVRAQPARARKFARAWSARACDSRAVRQRTVESTASLCSVSQALRNDA
eukprot:6721867-Lingulodinium_polyedra.AAC.1